MWIFLESCNLIRETEKIILSKNNPRNTSVGYGVNKLYKQDPLETSLWTMIYNLGLVKWFKGGLCTKLNLETIKHSLL